MLNDEIEAKTNVPGGRFVLPLKEKDTNNDLFRERFVVQGYLDREEELFVQASTTVGRQTVKLLLSLAKMFGYNLWSEDMTLADLQVSNYSSYFDIFAV